MKILIIALCFFLRLSSAQAQTQTTAPSPLQVEVQKLLASKWYERIQLKGYAQVRYNRLLETNRKITCPLCDGSIGDKQGFFMRRARLTFYGDINDRVYMYIQPDYATSATATFNGTTASQQNYFQIRDAYFDYNVTEDKEWRVRTGISKVPFGFDNLQSSGNRPALDRSDALNSAAPNERDTGVFLMYASTEARKRFKELANAGLKGTGDYGIFSIGAYNGQSLNRPERNNDLHRVARLTYPFKTDSGQFIEASLQAYEGKYNTIDTASATSVKKDFFDARQGASFIYYPQPFGFQAEYNVGQGPEFSGSRNTVVNKNLRGGYAQVSYAYEASGERYFPYVRYQEYEGGKKLMTNQQFNKMNEWEIGTEWQPNSAFELTAAYAISDRRTQSDATNRLHLKGNFLRLQAQFNY